MLRPGTRLAIYRPERKDPPMLKKILPLYLTVSLVIPQSLLASSPSVITTPHQRDKVLYSFMDMKLEGNKSNQYKSLYLSQQITKARNDYQLNPESFRRSYYSPKDDITYDLGQKSLQEVEIEVIEQFKKEVLGENISEDVLAKLAISSAASAAHPFAGVAATWITELYESQETTRSVDIDDYDKALANHIDLLQFDDSATGDLLRGISFQLTGKDYAANDPKYSKNVLALKTEVQQGNLKNAIESLIKKASEALSKSEQNAKTIEDLKTQKHGVLDRYRQIHQRQKATHSLTSTEESKDVKTNHPFLDQENMRNAQYTLGGAAIAAKLVGDDKMARDLQLSSNAVGKVANVLAKNIQNNPAMLFMGYMAAVQAVVAIFQSQDGEAAMMMKMMQKILKNLERMRKEIHARFDGIDEKLSKVLANQIIIHEQTSQNLASLRNHLKQMQMQQYQILSGIESKVDAIASKTLEHQPYHCFSKESGKTYRARSAQEVDACLWQLYILSTHISPSYFTDVALDPQQYLYQVHQSLQNEDLQNTMLVNFAHFLSAKLNLPAQANKDLEYLKEELSAYRISRPELEGFDYVRSRISLPNIWKKYAEITKNYVSQNIDFIDENSLKILEKIRAYGANTQKLFTNSLLDESNKVDKEIFQFWLKEYKDTLYSLAAKITSNKDYRNKYVKRDGDDKLITIQLTDYDYFLVSYGLIKQSPPNANPVPEFYRARLEQRASETGAKANFGSAIRMCNLASEVKLKGHPADKMPIQKAYYYGKRLKYLNWRRDNIQNHNYSAGLAELHLPVDIRQRVDPRLIEAEALGLGMLDFCFEKFVVTEAHFQNEADTTATPEYGIEHGRTRMEYSLVLRVNFFHLDHDKKTNSVKLKQVFINRYPFEGVNQLLSAYDPFKDNKSYYPGLLFRGLWEGDKAYPQDIQDREEHILRKSTEVGAKEKLFKTLPYITFGRYPLVTRKKGFRGKKITEGIPDRYLFARQNQLLKKIEDRRKAYYSEFYQRIREDLFRNPSNIENTVKFGLGKSLVIVGLKNNLSQSDQLKLLDTLDQLPQLQNLIPAYYHIAKGQYAALKEYIDKETAKVEEQLLKQINHINKNRTLSTQGDAKINFILRELNEEIEQARRLLY